MRKIRHAAARGLLPNLFDPPRKVQPPPPEIAVESIPLLERLLLDAKSQIAMRSSKPGRDAHER